MTKYLCDQMCLELGKWLRVAGYDTEFIRVPCDDREIFDKAVREERILLTRDRDFLEWDPEKKHLIYFEGEHLEDWVQQLNHEAGINWLLAPFSRCLRCNTLLQKIKEPIEKTERIPQDIEDFWICPHCSQLFWLGSHTESMERQLKNWQQ